MAAEGVFILLDIALEALCAKRLLIHPDVVGVVHVEEPTEEWQGTTISRNTIHLLAFERVGSCRNGNLARLDVGY